LSLLLLPLTALTAVLMVIRQATARPVRPAPLAMAAVTGTARRGLKNKKLLVLGGSGYLGSRICRAAVEAGYKVTALSRRGGPPKMDPALEQVEWRIGDATEAATLQGLVNEGYDCIVHAIGLLFDSQSGLANLNTIVSGSQSLPDANGTYDRITRQTAEDLIDAVLEATPANTQLPLAFISAAEAGWPDVPGGPLMDKIVPDFLKRYLIAKRVVEGRLTADNDGKIRPLILRPSLMWDWGKLDVLPAIPVFWAASKAGVPFVDRPVQVNTIAKAVVEGLDNDDVQGVIRFEKMDELAARNQWEF
jgi:nucleoside-diphosphate-sugar epimerase